MQSVILLSVKQEPSKAEILGIPSTGIQATGKVWKSAVRLHREREQAKQNTSEKVCQVGTG